MNLGVQDMLKELKIQPEVVQEENSDDSDIENEDYSTPLSRLRSLIKKIRNSEIVKNKYKGACETAGIDSTINPVLDCPTRWNSTFQMLEVALKVRNGLNVMCLTHQFYDYLIKEDEWTMLEKIHRILVNFKDLSTKLNAENYVTLPSVVVYFNLLLDDIETQICILEREQGKNIIDERILKGLVAAKNKMLKRYKLTNWIYCLVLILDPRFKIETFDKTSWGREMKTESIRLFHNKYKEYQLAYPLETVMTVSSGSSESLNIDSPSPTIDFNLLYEKPSKTSSQDYQKEFELYSKSKRCLLSDDILQWWKTHENSYPILSKMHVTFSPLLQHRCQQSVYSREHPLLCGNIEQD